MNRRTFLATAGAAVAGCAGITDAGTPAPPWPVTDPIADPDGTHDLFVENHTDRSETAWLRVVRNDDAVVVDGRYELPDGRGIRFDDVAAWERAYTIDIAIDGMDRRTFDWQTADCGSDAESADDDGSRNAAVRLEDVDPGDGTRLALRVDGCDAIDTGTVPTGSAERFRLSE